MHYILMLIKQETNRKVFMKNRKISLGIIDGVEYVKYIPTLFCHYDKCYSTDEQPEYWNLLSHKLRMCVELIRNQYFVIYCLHHRHVIGHAVVSRGGNFADSTDNDIVIGPIWISPLYRSNGYGTKLIKNILENLSIEYRFAYEFISPSNAASIRTVEKCGYEFLGNGTRTGIFKELKMDASGNWQVFRYTKRK